MQKVTVLQWAVQKTNLIVKDYVTVLKAIIPTARYDTTPAKLKTATLSVKEVKTFTVVKAIRFWSH